jgi:uncharacterized lipoprotein
MTIQFECDKCGRSLAANDPNRFIIRIEAFAAAGTIEMTNEELQRDPTEDIRSVLEELKQADADEIEDQTYRSMRFDLCATCHRTFLNQPLG